MNEIFWIGVKIALIVFGTALLVKLCNTIFEKIIKKNNVLHMKFMKSIMNALIAIFGIGTLGMQFQVTAEISKAVVQSTGLLVAVAGFAAQSVLADVISGIMISWCKPFEIGERVTLRSTDITGIVEDITIRHTVIRCFDDVRVIIPNSVINKELIQNSDYGTAAGNYVEFIVSFESDIRRAIEIVRETVLNHELVIDKSKDPNVDKEIFVAVSRWDPDGIILKVTVWTQTVNENFIACSDIRLLVKEAFDREGIEIPYNHIHVVNESLTEKTKINTV